MLKLKPKGKEVQMKNERERKQEKKGLKVCEGRITKNVH